MTIRLTSTRMHDRRPSHAVATTVLLLALLSVALSPRIGRAQGSGNGPDSLQPARSASSWALLGAFVGGALIVAPFDSHLAGEFTRPSLHAHAAVDRSASALRTIGDPGVLVLAASALLLGRATKQGRIADPGLHAAEAIVLSGATTAVLKASFGRGRPRIVGDTRPLEFLPFRLASGYSALPSGHTTVAFAAAASIQAELAQSAFGRRHRRTVVVATPLLFATATGVGLSRMYHDAHWASDVVLGAGIGTVVGRLVVRRQHRGNRGRVERWLLPADVAPTLNGVALRWALAVQ
jgi:membrane-associated phospholipid phosphatase